jgi:hypothetical protein
MSFAKIFAMSFASSDWLQKGLHFRLMPGRRGTLRAQLGWPARGPAVCSPLAPAPPGGRAGGGGNNRGRQGQPAIDPGAGALEAALARVLPPPAAGDRGRLLRSPIVPAAVGGARGGCEHEVGASAGWAGGGCDATPGRCPPLPRVWRARGSARTWRAAPDLLAAGVIGKRIAVGTP